jgi:mannose-6-phosphate isomerase-like protein (cupin superfamily)
MIRKIINTSGLVEFYTGEKCFITELFNTESFENLSIAKARVEPGVTTSLHHLANTVEIYFILSGKGEMEINGEPMGIVAENDLIVIPPDNTQRIKNVSNNDLVFLCICSPRFKNENYKSLV